METDLIVVRGLVGCAGDGWNLGDGEEKVLPRAIAESLMRAGYAEPVDVTPEIEKKDESARGKKSKRANAS